MLKHHRYLFGFMAIGYVLINVQPGTEQNVYEAVKSLPHVTDATVLFGDHDLIVKLEADALATIAKSVVEHIRSVEGVINTKTLAGADLV
jgi:DNA-binding Lrp family transcriptional regulator